MIYSLMIFSIIFSVIAFVFFVLALKERKNQRKALERSVVGFVFLILQFFMLFLMKM